MGPTGPIANQLDNFFRELIVNNVTLTTTYSAILIDLSFAFTNITAGGRPTIAIMTINASPSEATACNLTIGIFLNGSLEQEVTVGYAGAAINLTELAGKSLPSGSYNIAIRAKTSVTKPTNQFLLRIAIV
jgi:hypothetical protein